MKKYPLIEIKELINTTFKASLNKTNRFGLNNLTQIQIVKHLLDNEDTEVYQKDFENSLRLRKSTISGILDTMEKNRIIVRLSSEKDARGKIIKLSEEFRKQKEDMIKEMVKIDERIIEDISEEDLKVFYRVIDKMKDNINKGR